MSLARGATIRFSDWRAGLPGLPQPGLARGCSTFGLALEQRDILNRLLDGFEGKLTSSKWALIEKCSPDTALRDITEFVEEGILKKNEAGGRSTSYSLA